eukprot:scaffold12828_cov112-Isochrysis_galbana.AAC.10
MEPIILPSAAYPAAANTIDVAGGNPRSVLRVVCGDRDASSSHLGENRARLHLRTLERSVSARPHAHGGGGTVDELWRRREAGGPAIWEVWGGGLERLLFLLRGVLERVSRQLNQPRAFLGRLARAAVPRARPSGKAPAPAPHPPPPRACGRLPTGGRRYGAASAALAGRLA